MRDGTVRHYPGYQEDALYFRIPLTGDFELSCELTSSAWSHARIQYGGVRCDLGDSPKSFDLKYAGRPARKISLTPPLEHLGDWAAYRLKVKDGTCTVFVNDRQILSEPLAVSFDPWLLFDVPHDDTGAVRNFKITGNPSVAERLDLSGGFTLGAWRSDYAENQWQKRGEIYSPGEKPVLIEGRPAPPRLRARIARSITTGRCWKTAKSSMSSTTSRERVWSIRVSIRSRFSCGSSESESTTSPRPPTFAPV